MILPSYLLVFFFFFFLLDDLVLPLSSASGGECPPFFECGNLGRLLFPLTTPQYKHCGILPIHGCDEHLKTVYFGGKKFNVTRIDNFFKTVFVKDADLEKSLENESCDALSWNITLPPPSPLGSFQILPNITMYKCNSSLHYNYTLPMQFLNYTGCRKSNNETIFFRSQDVYYRPSSLANCSRVQLPVNTLAFSPDPFTFIASEFSLTLLLSQSCNQCILEKGFCHLKSTEGIYCSKLKGMHP